MCDWFLFISLNIFNRCIKSKIFINELLIFNCHPNVELSVNILKLFAVYYVVSGCIKPKHFISNSIQDLRADMIFF